MRDQSVIRTVHFYLAMLVHSLFSNVMVPSWSNGIHPRIEKPVNETAVEMAAEMVQKMIEEWLTMTRRWGI
jgi:hypothetical protein